MKRGRDGVAMNEAQREPLNSGITSSQKADELAQHALQGKQQSFGAVDFRFELEARVIFRRQSIRRARIRRNADEPIEVIAHLGPESFRHAIARQPHQQPDRAHADSLQLLRNPRIEIQPVHRHAIDSRTQCRQLWL